MRYPADFWKEHLQLHQHVEGGWFRETYRSPLRLEQDIHTLYKGERSAATHIYFLLEPGAFSAFHRIVSDELWHFYAGDPIVIFEITKNGELVEHLLGSDPGAGHRLTCLVSGGNWFGSRLIDGGEYGLAGCTVSPGFDFADFEMASRDKMLSEFPQHAGLIRSLTRE